MFDNVNCLFISKGGIFELFLRFNVKSMLLLVIIPLSHNLSKVIYFVYNRYMVNFSFAVVKLCEFDCFCKCRTIINFKLFLLWKLTSLRGNYILQFFGSLFLECLDAPVPVFIRRMKIISWAKHFVLLFQCFVARTHCIVDVFVNVSWKFNKHDNCDGLADFGAVLIHCVFTRLQQIKKYRPGNQQVWAKCQPKTYVARI